MKKLQFVLVFLILSFTISAKEYHVSKSGKDKNNGTLKSPFLTIQTAANIALPGDIITVHEGVYRERINPPRGGASDNKRIVYQAAKGEKVVIKGSEIIKDWEKIEEDVWKVTLPDSFFGSTIYSVARLSYGPNWIAKYPSMKFIALKYLVFQKLSVMTNASIITCLSVTEAYPYTTNGQH